MRITELRTFRADGGWRPFSFLKVLTDEGLSGWAEFAEGAWSPALPQVILGLGQSVIGEDPRHFARLSAQLHAVTRFAAGGLNHQAVAAIENACIDIAAKALAVPVHALFGGPMREAVDLYWSHCGSFRARHAELFERVLGLPPLRSLDDLRGLGREAVRRGFKAIKTNPILFGDPSGPRLLNPGFVREGLELERTVGEPLIRAIEEQMHALREGSGPDTGLMLDVNFAFRPASLRRIARRLEPVRPAWLEADLPDPAALAQVRGATCIPVASLETLHGQDAYRRALQAGAVDVAVVDVPWNGLREAIRIASLAEAFEVNVAPHNFYGPLADLMSAHFCAIVPNAAIMEIEGDDVPWKYALLGHAPQILDGRFMVPERPGWGAEPDEEVIAAHPWKDRHSVEARGGTLAAAMSSLGCVSEAGGERMSDDPSRGGTKAKPGKPLPRRPPQPYGGMDESGLEADETVKYRDRPADDGKHGDAGDEPVSGYPEPPPSPVRKAGK
jgi:galactonate dehydratase